MAKVKQREKARAPADERDWEEIKKEGASVMEQIQFSSVVPERENLPYYLISMTWFNNWQAYTGCAPRQADVED